MNPAPTIAIVGRPNVGKSTLFNRLIGKRHAVVAKEAGTTRDRVSQKFECGDYEPLLVDTGGLEYGKQENIEANIQIQAQIAIDDADIILFVIDIGNELTVDDFAAVDILRKSKKSVIFIANKCDNPNIEAMSYNFYELGFGKPITISAIHKLGVDELKDSICEMLKKLKFKKASIKNQPKNQNSICILGKPNAGKSSLVNALWGSEKVIVSDIPGTTRDSTSTEITYNDTKFEMIDTAGLKRPGKTIGGIDKFSTLRTLRSIQEAEVVILLIDGTKGVTSQDCHIAEHALENEKGLILAVNKIDLFEDKEEEENIFISRLRRRFAFVPWAPIIFVSAKNKKNTYKLLDLALEIIEERNKRVQTAELNSFLQKITQKHLPASTKMKKPKFMYASQVDTRPPKFVLFFKNQSNMHFSYPRYLENEIRKEYGFNGTAIDLKFKQIEGGPRKESIHHKESH